MDALAVKFGDWEIAHDESEPTQGVMHNPDMVPMWKLQESKPYASSAIANKGESNCDLWSVLREKLESCAIIEQQGVSGENYFLISDAAHAHTSVAAEASELELMFNGLVKKWQDETGGYSVTTRRYANRSYHSILLLKEDAIPLILNELKVRPDWWFEALEVLTNANPVKPNSTFEEAVNAWLEWGEKYPMQ